MSGTGREIDRNEHSLVKIGFVLTVFVVSIFVLVYLDNKVGFRASGTFADLLSSFAAALSTVWLVVAVLSQGKEIALQRDELKLQRQELTLQREETARLADTASAQAEILRHELKIRRREHFIQDIGRLIGSEAKAYAALCSELRTAAGNIATTKCGRGYWQSGFMNFGSRNMEVTCRKENAKSTKTFVSKVRYVEISKHRDPNDARLTRLRKIYRDCVRSGDGAWFRKDAPVRLSSVEGVSAFDLWLLLNVAARYKK